MTFQKFDASGYKASWQEQYFHHLFKSRAKVWDARDPIQLQRLETIAFGIKQWLDTLPDGAEVGTMDLVRQLLPEAIKDCDEDFYRFLIRRIERCRYAALLAGYYYAVPDPRWKKMRHFYKYHKWRPL